MSTFGVFVLTALALSTAGVIYAKRTLGSVARVDLPSLTQEGKSVDQGGNVTIDETLQAD